MTRRGILYDPAKPDMAVLDIEGPEFLATGWAADLDGPPPRPGSHRPGCRFADLRLDDACPCQPPL
ncbi:MAG: hypothetical protein HOW97_02460 [Catenulispora sp.]|nr:hypothetical protein [Catenulispora sp.]